MNVITNFLDAVSAFIVQEIGIILTTIVIFFIMLTLFRMRGLWKNLLKSLEVVINLGIVRFAFRPGKNIPDNNLHEILAENFNIESLSPQALEEAETLRVINPKASISNASDAVFYKLNNIVNRLIPGSDSTFESPVELARKHNIFGDDLLKCCDSLIEKGNMFKFSLPSSNVDASSEDALLHINEAKRILNLLDLQSVKHIDK